MCFSFSTFFKFFTQIQVLIWVFFLFHIFHCFSPQSRSYSLCLSFYNFFIFFAKIQVLLYFSYFSFFTVTHHNPDPTVCVSQFDRFLEFLTTFLSYHVSFSFSSFVSFLAIFQFLLCAIFIFHVF